ncbi:MAG: 16S rRNA (guanine(966)-N(2))-methyltransferase RsmD [SAR86 cluster bacterium]|nr:16S rRNA (guanine(966)-N(2))-methyltransferase RsmD [SAR86 cluster bacterium]MDA8708999.1 16S rRNA (guanine(966)-N(2))-methyltransferase RsmD [Gammaproteobacteria bacterium]MBL6822479.1 16S rRNA (guanine(966)-N(2))-methyltransferase RsmD [SAR86 cluster bacterium]MDA8798591.1 16S rRNA (guanine(966)-N(2))-methyltransferase RsmD [Gammaproteobacteria bacterium]MDA9140993.1 16S rRNA (guanine(966)-N(2))-methyltransferase RsmD [Gammaproteobacteria bacterium]
MNTSSIRIIGGRNKSYRIVFKATPALRPTTDRAKETLFSWLQFELKDMSCLDLFAGTGGLGLEALSRGAQHVTFVEKNKSLYKNILKNVSHLGYENNVQAMCSDSFKWLKTNKRKFDYIFLDPPFNQFDYKSLLRAVHRSNIINEGGKIFLETSKHAELELSHAQDILKDKIIGDVRLIILQ